MDQVWQGSVGNLIDTAERRGLSLAYLLAFPSIAGDSQSPDCFENEYFGEKM